MVPAYVALQVITIVSTKGAWRLIYAIPVVPMTVIFAWTLFAYLQQSNIWPLVLFFTLPLALMYLALVGAVFLLIKNTARWNRSNRS